VQLVDPTLGLAQSHESLPEDEARGQLVLGPLDLALVDGAFRRLRASGILSLVLLHPWLMPLAPVR
jgi:hypothetical protein